MIKRTLNAVWFGAVFGASLMLSAALALTVTGRNSENRQSIFQMGIQAMSVETGITASTTQSQVGAYQLSAGVSQITTANANDAVKLPSLSALGSPSNVDASLNVTVINNTAGNITLYPFAATDVIVMGGTAAGAGALKTLATLTTTECWSISTTGRWYCTSS